MKIKKFNKREDYDRIVRFLAEQYKINKNMVCWLPERFDDLIFRIDTLYHDERGLEKSSDYIYIFEDNSWVMIRFSGTENLLRYYLEFPTEIECERNIKAIQNYIDKVQEDTLSSYPITIQAESVDMTSMMTSLMGVQAELEENRHEKDAVYSSTVLYEMMNSMVSADTQTNNYNKQRRYDTYSCKSISTKTGYPHGICQIVDHSQKQ